MLVDANVGDVPSLSLTSGRLLRLHVRERPQVIVFLTGNPRLVRLIVKVEHPQRDASRHVAVQVPKFQCTEVHAFRSLPWAHGQLAVVVPPQMQPFPSSFGISPACRLLSIYREAPTSP